MSDHEADRGSTMGEGPVGIKSPGADTLHKGTPADDQSPKATGIESEGGQSAETLGKLTQGSRGV